MFLISSCGNLAGKLTIRDEQEHQLTLALEEGERITFWTKMDYYYSDHMDRMDILFDVRLLKDGKPYKSFLYRPMATNPTYLSSTEQWIHSRERNPDWIRPRDRVWEEDHLEGKYIMHYGTKEKRKGKNTPVLDITEGGYYTFHARVIVYAGTEYEIRRAELLLRK